MQLGDLHESHLREGVGCRRKGGGHRASGRRAWETGKGERLGSGNEQSAKIGGCPGQRSNGGNGDVKETRLHNSQPWATNTKIQRRRAGQGIQYKLKSLRELGISLAVAVLPEPETNPTQGGRTELQPPPPAERLLRCDGRPGGPPNATGSQTLDGGGGVEVRLAPTGHPTLHVRNGHRPSGNPAPSAQALLSVPGAWGELPACPVLSDVQPPSNPAIAHPYPPTHAPSLPRKTRYVHSSTMPYVVDCMPL